MSETDDESQSPASVAARTTQEGADQWKRIRAAVFSRDGGRCMSCGIAVASADADIHHLVPRAAGGRDDPANLITLCDGCHAARHPNLQASLARRLIERWSLRLAHWLDRRGDIESLDESLGAALRLLKVERFRSPQLEVVRAAMRGESILLVSATGSGKSLCFQIPILLSRGTGFVISPLKALMSQQVEGLQNRQIPGTFINGDIGPHEKALRYKLLGAGVFKFLFCTPERFDRPAEVKEISVMRPSFLVVDEAHCIDRWGRDFRPSYGRLGSARALLGSPPVLAFTATAGVESQRRILESLGIPDARVIVTGVNRPNIALARLPDLDESSRLRLITQLLAAMPPGRAMIFVPTVRVGNEVRVGLLKQGRDVPFYHSKQGKANDRDMLLGQFTGRLAPAQNVVICTNAFGMGLDVPDVRLVIHWQHPASVEDYLQECGRAGRDGNAAVAILFTGQKDEGLLKFMAEKTSQSTDDEDGSATTALEGRYHAIAQMKRSATDRQACFRNAIVRHFGEEVSSEDSTIATGIVAWLFERRTKQQVASHCCDRCDGVRVGNVVEWASHAWEPRPARWSLQSWFSERSGPKRR